MNRVAVETRTLFALAYGGVFVRAEGAWTHDRRGSRIDPKLLLRGFLTVFQKYYAGRAVVIHPALGGLPAGFALICECRADNPPFVRTIFDFPARCIIEELFDTFNADLLRMDQFADAPQPLDIVFRVKPVPPLSCRQDQPMLLVKPQGLCRGSDKLCGNSHGVERRVLVF
jgi:hypothetical protein